MKKYKNIFFILVTMSAILAQLVNPTLAYADGETPLPPTEIATEAAPTEIPSVTDLPTQPDTLGTEATPTELPVATEFPASDSPTIDPVAIDISASDAIVTEEPTLLEIMEQIPAHTDIVVLDTTGEAIPLATQAAADVVIEGDPVWCPGTQTPTPGANGCSASYSSLSSLVAGFVPTSNGTIWIQSGADTGGNVTINGTGSWSSAATYSLTLQGGWSGVSGDIAIGTNSVFSVPISIINWTGSVAVNDIAVIEAAGTGLTITTAGNISLDNVNTSNNSGLGASLDNTTSSSNASVTLTGSNTFNGNGNTGLYVLSDGNIALNNITANGNGRSYDCTSDDDWSDCHSGVTLENYTGTGDVTLTGVNIFNDNKYGWGLYVNTMGAISLKNAIANGNGLDGVALYGYKSVTVTGVNVFNSNGYEGLYVVTLGGLEVENVTANSNEDAGALLYSLGSTGYVTLAGANVFSNNYYEGLYIISRGNISLSNVTSKDNGFKGGYSAPGVYLSTPLNVSINSSMFSGNANYGIDAHRVCGSLNFDGVTLANFSSNGSGDYLNPSGTDYTYYDYVLRKVLSTECKGNVTVDGKPIAQNTTLTSVFEANNGNDVEFDLSCERRTRFPVMLTNGDQIEIICPVSGTARIKRLDNTMLPAELPVGYIYSSAFSLEILQNNKPINYINEGGSVKVSFDVPYVEEGVAYSILYLDNGVWVPLKEFILDGNGNPRGFNLHANDSRRILSGSNFIFEEGSPTRLEISTNFPGIFVLAQH